MLLALLYGQCEDELICDFAETYRIYNWRELPLKTAAILASGLSQDSRCMRKINGQKLRASEYTQLAILDELRIVRWLLTSDGAQGKNQPESMLQHLLEPQKKSVGYRTAEEFEATRQRIISGVG